VLSYPYDVRADAPVNVHHRPDCRAGLAAEDRDLRAESRRHDACIGAALEVLSALYPTFITTTIQN
jgi:hypothetical protein